MKRKAMVMTWILIINIIGIICGYIYFVGLEESLKGTRGQKLKSCLQLAIIQVISQLFWGFSHVHAWAPCNQPHVIPQGQPFLNYLPLRIYNNLIIFTQRYVFNLWKTSEIIICCNMAVGEHTQGWNPMQCIL